MFLNRLNDVEKKAFLNLAHYIARSDNDFSQSQQDIISTYCTEMQIDDIDFDKESFDLDETLNLVKNQKSRKIVMLEIMALVYSDDYLHPAEKEVLDKMIEVFELNSNLSIIYTQWAKSMLALYIQGNALIEL